MPAKPAGLRSGHVFVLAVLLIAPGTALFRLGVFLPPVLAVAIAFVISVAAFAGHWIDKRRAEADRWRTSENTLHLLELLGGWPGAFLAQRIFRHKTAKPGYQVVFWLIVVAHEYAAIDFLLGWKLAHSVSRLIGL
jgi:uncharacterized membrane protein YsdA (DUF1294 family)